MHEMGKEICSLMNREINSHWSCDDCITECDELCICKLFVKIVLMSLCRISL